jgi:hypothetical protein
VRPQIAVLAANPQKTAFDSAVEFCRDAVNEHLAAGGVIRDVFTAPGVDLYNVNSVSSKRHGPRVRLAALA